MEHALTQNEEDASGQCGHSLKFSDVKLIHVLLIR